MQEPTSHTATLRQRRVHWRQWGASDAPLIVMVHGWMDTAYTFQFLANAMVANGWRVVAPDLRGFGHTEPSRENASGYWFADYVADLEAFVDHVSPNAQANLVGHSLGGNIVCIYAGVRPARVRCVVSLDGFGVPRGAPSQAPEKLTAWLDAVRVGESLKPYATLDAVAQRLRKNDPYLIPTNALTLAREWTALTPDGQYRVLADPAHKLPFPTVYHLDETIEIWRRVTAPVLWIGAANSHIAQWLGYGRDDPADMGADSKHSDEFRERLAAFSNLTFELINDASHNLHHEKAREIGDRLHAFLTATRA